MEVNFVKRMVLYTYLLNNNTSLDNAGILFHSSSTIKMFAKTGTRGGLIATPSKCVLVSQGYSHSLAFFGISAFTSFLP